MCKCSFRCGAKIGQNFLLSAKELEEKSSYKQCFVCMSAFSQPSCESALYPHHIAHHPPYHEQRHVCKSKRRTVHGAVQFLPCLPISKKIGEK